MPNIAGDKSLFSRRTSSGAFLRVFPSLSFCVMSLDISQLAQQITVPFGTAQGGIIVAPMP